MYKMACTFVGCLMAICSVFAQDNLTFVHQLHHFSVNDGLPSSEVYYALQDKKGYMWFATDAGVVRFDGSTFRTFDQSDGLTDNTVFQLFEDSKGRIWFGTFNLQFCYFWQDSIYEYQYNDNIKENLNIAEGLNSLYFDEKEGLSFGFDYNGVYQVDIDGQIHQRTTQADSSISYASCFINKGSKLFGNSFVYSTEFKIQFDIRSSTDSFSLLHNFGAEHPTNRFIICPIGGNRFLVFGFNTIKLLYQNDKGLIGIKEIASNLNDLNIYSCFVDGDEIWLSCQKKGIYKTQLKNDSLLLAGQLLATEEIATIYCDETQGMWFQSLKDGVYYMPDKTSQSIDLNSEVFSMALDSVAKQLYISLGNWEVYQLIHSPKGVEFREIAGQYKSRSYLNFDHQKACLNIFSERSMHHFMYCNDNLYPSISMIGGGIRQTTLRNDTLYAVGSLGLSVSTKDSLIFSSPVSKQFLGACLLSVPHLPLLIGTDKGLKKLDGFVLQPWISDTLLSCSITALIDYKDVLLVGTKSHGIFVLNDSVVYDQITIQDGLSSNLIRTLFVDSENQLWAATNQGLNKIEYQPSLKSKSVQIKNHKQGLVSNDITAIQEIDGYLIVGTKNGLTKIDLANQAKYPPRPSLYFLAMKINNKLVDLNTSYTLKHHQNSLFFKYLALDNRSFGDFKFEYRLIGVDSSWIFTDNQELFFSGLKPGNYQLELRAKNIFNVYSNVQRIIFKISNPIWLRWWFLILVFSMVFLLIAVFIKNREIKITEQAYLETKLVELELKGLRSQMNPYFIFNTLSSIQHAINTKEKQFASDFITQFGRLIRLVLESSRKPTIQLAKEIEILNLYVKLESFQFSDRLRFEIKLDELIDLEVLEIPSMIIQPFIENALVYSLKPSSSEQLNLSVEFKMLRDDMLMASIEYNGVQRLETVSNNEASVLASTKNRLEHYSRETNNKFSIEFYDLKGTQDHSMGTGVEIVFVL